MSFGWLGSALLPASCPLPAFWHVGVLEREPWCCVSDAQQQTACGCVTNTLLDTSAKHSTMRCEQCQLQTRQAHYSKESNLSMKRQKDREAVLAVTENIRSSTKQAPVYRSTLCSCAEKEKGSAGAEYESAIQHFYSHVLQSVQSNFHEK